MKGYGESGPHPHSESGSGEVRTPLQAQRAAAKVVGYGAIMLRREGDYAIVEIEFNGKWREVIREHLDSNFSHIIEPLGIQEAIFGGNEVKAQ